MKEYFDYKRSRQHYTEISLRMVIVAFIAMSLSYSAQADPCTSGSIDFNAAASCTSATVAAYCYGDDLSDTVTVNDNGSTVTSLPLYGDSANGNCYDTTWDGDPTTVTLSIGLNKLTATSAEIGTSTEVDITVSANGASVTLSSSWTSSGDWPSKCGLLINFEFQCLTAYETYTFHEDVTIINSCPDCVACSESANFLTDGSGTGWDYDESQTLCPGDVTQTCNCTDVQDWHINDAGPNNYQYDVMDGSTVRIKSATYNPPNNTSTISLSSAG